MLWQRICRRETEYSCSATRQWPRCCQLIRGHLPDDANGSPSEALMGQEHTTTAKPLNEPAIGLHQKVHPDRRPINMLEPMAMGLRGFCAGGGGAVRVSN
jgi:hypothetical protein